MCVYIYSSLPILAKEPFSPFHVTSFCIHYTPAYPCCWRKKRLTNNWKTLTNQDILLFYLTTHNKLRKHLLAFSLFILRSSASCHYICPLFYVSTTSSHLPSGGLCNMPRPSCWFIHAHAFLCVPVIWWHYQFLRLCSISYSWTMSMEHQWDDTVGENWSIQREMCPSTSLSATNSTWTGLGLNPGRCSEELITNHLSRGTALHLCCFSESL
jgi:hypothetical protein